MKKKRYKPRDNRIVSYNMSRIRGKNTKPEIVLRKALWREGLRYRIHYNLPGRPDMVFPKQRIVVFCDGGFWHGKNFNKTKKEIKKNERFWIKKISDNIKRDKRINYKLRRMGWKVLRFWDDTILKNTYTCIRKIKKTIENYES